MERYICIHGHFYQPPRENPWLEAVETQSSAYPYHDWNERISAECYATNAAARVLDGNGKIAQIASNYERMSFNFGPTLLAWLEEADPDTYARVIEADKVSREHFSGHGSAIAQVYNHIIMPLAHDHDKVTQVVWGIADFEKRFGRKPEGMWLAETAVDIPTLEVLADYGITFTILAQYQGGRIRKMGTEDWQDVMGGNIDPTRAYRQTLPSGKTIDLFFYDGPISRAIAFEHLLDTGETFANRLVGAFNDDRDWPQLVHIATDGETYGHHHKQGEMGLAYALKYIEDQGLAKVTNYGEYLEKFPPEYEVEIVEDTSWSCAHGIERWRSNCGCNGGGYPTWNQEWRAPLRATYDWLRDTLAPVYEQEAGKIFSDPWAARNRYAEIMLDRSDEHVNAVLTELAGRPLSAEEEVTALKLLEMQRHLLLMYTSCGWFFDELSGLETVQTIQYAGRAVQIARDFVGPEIEDQFKTHLAEAKSNIPENKDGATIYERFVVPAAVSLRKVTAHYALSDLFEEYPDETSIYCYRITRTDHHVLKVGRSRMSIGKAQVCSEVTREQAELAFASIFFDNHNVTGGVNAFADEAAYQSAVAELTDAFEQTDMTRLLRILDDDFDRRVYSLNQLFRDEQIKILNIIQGSAIEEAERLNAQIYENQAPLIRSLVSLYLGVPDILHSAADFTLKAQVQHALQATELNPGRIQQLLHEADLVGVRLESENLAYQAKVHLNQIMRDLRDAPTEMQQLQHADTLVDLTRMLPFPVDTWFAQNICWDLMQRVLPEQQAKADAGDQEAVEWTTCFRSFADKLSMLVPAPLQPVA